MNAVVSPYKWVGAKFRQRHELLSRMPEHFVDYYEVFAGSGALRLALPEHRRALLADLNSNLIKSYEWLLKDMPAVEGHLKSLKNRYMACNSKKRALMYDRIRNEFRADACSWSSGALQAARMIFLNRTCYNGVYRESHKSGFNVSHAGYERPLIVPPGLSRFVEVISSTRLVCSDFREVLNKPQGGDFVYCDPPYDETYNLYTRYGFSDADQEDLALALRRLDRRDVYWMVSNSDTTFIRSLYEGFRIETVLARRSVSRSSKGRKSVYELIIRNY